MSNFMHFWKQPDETYLKNFEGAGKVFYFFILVKILEVSFSLMYRNNRSFFDWRRYIAIGSFLVFSQNNSKQVS